MDLTLVTYLLYLAVTVPLTVWVSADVETGRQLMEVVSTKVGGVALVIGIIHFANVWCLNALRRRALLRAQAMPPVAPNRYTTVMPPPVPTR